MVEFGIDRLTWRTLHRLLVKPLVAVDHLFHRELLLDPAATAAAIQRPKLAHFLNHLVLSLSEIAGLAIFDQLGHCAATISQDGSTRGHRFDYYHAERFVPLERKQKTFGLAHHSRQIAMGKAIDVADLVAIDVRF